MIAAILRAQLLSMRLARGSVLGIVAGVIWYGFWIFIAVVTEIAMEQTDAGTLARTLPLGLAGVFAYWQLIPMVSASFGASLDMRKLLVYPAPHDQLFLVEVLLRLTTGVEMMLVLIGGTIGLVRNPASGGAAALPRIGIALLIFVAFNLLLASGLRSILERLLARRRVREILAVLMAIIWVLPRFLMTTEWHPKSFGGAGEWVQAVAFPWTSAARAATGQSVPLSILSLMLWSLAALWFGRAQFERSLRYDVLAAQATPMQPPRGRLASWIELFFRWPSMLWRDPLAGIVEKELRSLARTPRFRMVFIMGFTFGLLVWFPIMAGRPSASGSSPYFLIVVSVYALILLGQVSYWNCFGFDGSAAAFYFAAPQPMSKILLGKNIAALVYVYLDVLILIAITLAFHLTESLWNVIEDLIVVGVCATYVMAFGNISSVRYPRASRPERVSQGGSSGRFHGLIFLLFPVTLLPVVLAYLARYTLDSNVAFAVVLGLAALLGFALYAMAMESSVHSIQRRREEFMAELSKGEGPVVSG